MLCGESQHSGPPNDGEANEDALARTVDNHCNFSSSESSVRRSSSPCACQSIPIPSLAWASLGRLSHTLATTTSTFTTLISNSLRWLTASPRLMPMTRRRRSSGASLARDRPALRSPPEGIQQRHLDPKSPPFMCTLQNSQSLIDRSISLPHTHFSATRPLANARDLEDLSRSYEPSTRQTAVMSEKSGREERRHDGQVDHKSRDIMKQRKSRMMMHTTADSLSGCRTAVISNHKLLKPRNRPQDRPSLGDATVRCCMGTLPGAKATKAARIATMSALPEAYAQMSRTTG